MHPNVASIEGFPVVCHLLARTIVQLLANIPVTEIRHMRMKCGGGEETDMAMARGDGSVIRGSEVTDMAMASDRGSVIRGTEVTDMAMARGGGSVIRGRPY